MFLAENGKKFGLERFLILLQKGKKQGHNANKSINTKGKNGCNGLFRFSFASPYGPECLLFATSIPISPFKLPK